MSGVVEPGHPSRPGPGSPHRTGNDLDSPAESAVLAGLGREGAVVAYVEPLVNRLQAADARATGCASPARGQRPLHHGWLRVGVRVGLLIPKATEGLFKLKARYALTIRSAGLRQWSRWASLCPSQFCGPCLSNLQPKVPKPLWCASTPLLLILLSCISLSLEEESSPIIQAESNMQE
jgi:hypothetical protein